MVLTFLLKNKWHKKGKGREERYQIVCGLFAHELGHILYTDFLADQTYHNRLENNIWFPEPPDLKTAADIANEADFWKYVKEDPANRVIVHYISHQIANVLEDGYIENKMKQIGTDVGIIVTRRLFGIGTKLVVGGHTNYW